MARSRSETAASLFSGMQKIVTEEIKQEELIMPASVKEPEPIPVVSNNAKVEKTSKELPQAAKTVKRGTGRPRKKIGDYARINFEVPVALRDAMDIALKGHDNNLTTYMNHLIIEDLKRNMDYYKSLERPELENLWQ